MKIEREFSINDMRFPRGEGHWMIWSDASKKFNVEARYLTRSNTHVTLLKSDGSQIKVPIDQLASLLKRQVEKRPLPGMENAVDGVNPIHVDDKVQFHWYRDWVDAVVTDVMPGKVTLKYGDTGKEKTETVELSKVRFPNGEGHWRKWSDDSGESAIVARHLSRSESEVQLRTEDGLKYWFDWREARVKRTFAGGAEAEFSYREKLETKEFDLDDIRFPDGEGRWRSWSDDSGKFNVVARFLYRDETHVTIRKEDGAIARVEIAMLSGKIRKLLNQTPIIAPRPPLVRFAEPSGEVTAVASADFESVSLSQTVVASVEPLRQGGMTFAILHGDSVSSAYSIGDVAQTVAVATFASSHYKDGITQL